MDTIAAIATPLGEGGIGIIRISGPQAIEAADHIFVHRRGKKLAKMPSHRIYYGHIVYSDGRVIDEVLVSLMRAPRTYTREDVIEINCHGGLQSLQQILQQVLAQDGVRMAEPGEFTKMAFLNGRIDLVQAEAVIDVIRAGTERALQVSVDQLRGGLSQIITDIRNILLNARAEIEVSIDYPEYDQPDVTRDVLKNKLNQALHIVQKLLDESQTGRILREGIKTVIAGKPNVGKSSLLNVLLGVERAIVTDIPGTTRDTVEEMLDLGGIPLHVIDTAGIHHSEDPVEKIGIERSRQALAIADLVLLVIDVSRGLSEEDKQLYQLTKSNHTLVILNKIDLPEQLTDLDVQQQLGVKPENMIAISTLKKEGLDQLTKRVHQLFMQGQVKGDHTVMVSRMRHIQLLKEAKEALNQAIVAINHQIPVDMVAIDIEKAWQALGLIIGKSVEEDLIDHIFAEFCLGK